MITRRVVGGILVSAATAATFGISATSVCAADIVVKVGVDLPLTGANTAGVQRLRNAILLAFEAPNQGGEIHGYRIEPIFFDDATSTAGQEDPAQGATNARKMVYDKDTVAAFGPLGSSTAKAMLPILSEGNLATIATGATNPDLTDPKFAPQFRPAGKVIFFRVCTTDAYQGPNMANFFAEVLKVRSVYVLDDGSAGGIGAADSFQARATEKGIKVLGRDHLESKAADYAAVLTKIKQLDSEALYFGGTPLAGVKLAKQAYEIIPDVIKGANDGSFSTDLLTGAGFPAVEGWYVTIAAPHLTDNARAAPFMQRYQGKFGNVPSDYTILAFDAALVIIDAIKRVAASGTPVTRNAVRDAIQASNLETIQGTVSFDANGDIRDRTISVFQIRKDNSKPLNSVRDQFRYIAAAPQD